MERGNEYICGKYVPKTKTNGITIPLKNRVMVCASIANLGAESYWSDVYSLLNIDIGQATTAFLRSQDQARDYKKTIDH